MERSRRDTLRVTRLCDVALPIHTGRRTVPRPAAAPDEQAASRRYAACTPVNGITLGAMARRNAPFAAICHCGAIRIFVRRIPRTLTSCNCSICRRYGALWAYYAASSVSIEAPKRGLSTYSWNRRIRIYHRCAKCGCVMHYSYRKRQRNRIIAVNAVNFDPSALVGARIRHLDGAATWKFVDPVAQFFVDTAREAAKPPSKLPVRGKGSPRRGGRIATTRRPR